MDMREYIRRRFHQTALYQRWKARHTHRREVRKRPLVIVHGLGVGPWVMILFEFYLRRMGYRTVSIKVPTLRSDLPGCAEVLSRKLAELGYKEIDIVTHSMGGVILRWAYNNFPMPKIRRAVLMGPPNNGSFLAGWLTKKVPWLFIPIFGKSGQQLRPGNLGLASRAGNLDGIEFGIIAGGNGTQKGIMHVWPIPGDNDGMVAVEETILPGMRDFTLVRLEHTGMVLLPGASRLVAHFLENGCFKKRRRAHRMEDEDEGNRIASESISLTPAPGE